MSAGRATRPTHRAARIVAPGRADVVEIPIRSPEPGEVRVRVEGCGVCASSLPLWEGRPWFEYPGPPGAPGHEGWGVIDAVGEGVRGPVPGDRVAVLSQRAFAELDYAPADRVTRLDPAMGSAPFPGEALGCAMNVFRRSDVRDGHRVAVVGSGFLGSLLIGLSRRAGARVAAVSRRASSLASARRYGAEAAFRLGDDPRDVVQAVEAWSEGAFCDRVVEATGLAGPLALAGELTGVRGRLVVAGFHQDGPRTIDLQLWNWRGIDVVNAHERDPAVYLEGMRKAREAFSPDGIDPSPLYSHVVPLDRIDRAFELLRTRPEGFVKAILTVEGGNS